MDLQEKLAQEFDEHIKGFDENQRIALKHALQDVYREVSFEMKKFSENVDIYRDYSQFEEEWKKLAESAKDYANYARQKFNESYDSTDEFKILGNSSEFLKNKQMNGLATIMKYAAFNEIFNVHLMETGFKEENKRLPIMSKIRKARQIAYSIADYLGDLDEIKPSILKMIEDSYKPNQISCKL